MNLIKPTKVHLGRVSLKLQKIKIRHGLYLFRRSFYFIAALYKKWLTILVSVVAFALVIYFFKDSESLLTAILKPATAFISGLTPLVEAYYLSKDYKRKVEIHRLKRRLRFKNHKLHMF